MKAISAAREVSFRILSRVQAGGYASDLLRQETAAFDSRDAALAETLYSAVCATKASLIS